jgi:hypothetical protein
LASAFVIDCKKIWLRFIFIKNKFKSYQKIKKSVKFNPARSFWLKKISRYFNNRKQAIIWKFFLIDL